jgi:hypothetical protein
MRRRKRRRDKSKRELCKTHNERHELSLFVNKRRRALGHSLGHPHGITTHGSSRQAINKYILSHVNVGNDTKVVNQHLKTGLRRTVSLGKIKHAKGEGPPRSFKLAEGAKKRAVDQPKTTLFFDVHEDCVCRGSLSRRQHETKSRCLTRRTRSTSRSRSTTSNSGCRYLPFTCTTVRTPGRSSSRSISFKLDDDRRTEAIDRSTSKPSVST